MNINEFEEVLNPMDANRVVVISETWGRNWVRKKVYFNVGVGCGIGKCLRYVIDNYSDVLGCDIRIDTYNVRNGRAIGRC